IDRIPDLVDDLDRRISGAVEPIHPPRWWSVLGGLQWLLLLAAVAGGLWLGVLAGLSYLQLPTPGTAQVGPLPLPTVLLVAGILLGLAAAGMGGLLARQGAERRARRVRR